MLKLEIQAGRTLLISGPASVRLEDGLVSIFGAPIHRRGRFTVRREKQIPIEIVEDSKFDVEFGERATYLEVEGSTVPESWKEATGRIGTYGESKILIIGSTDTGKSTFSIYLTNQMVKNNRRVAIVDADIGQSDLGPPGSIGLSLVTEPLIEFEGATVEAMIFIGETSPSRVVDRVINGIMKLEAKIPYGTVKVINTDGWVADEGAIEYKVKMAERLAPSLIIGLDDVGELDTIMSRVKTPKMKIRVPKYIKVRSREERKHIREHGYRRYLREAVYRNFLLDRIEAPDLLERKPEKGNILGFIDNDGFMVGIGIFESLNRRRGILRAYTNVNFRKVSRVECGNIRLSPQGQELPFSLDQT
ncbi:MAG: Clp1/GlmU family protein [Candidatus Bathyarchaeia archaeon]